MENKEIKKIPIVVSPDDAYTIPTYVMLHSLINNKADEDIYDIIVLTKDMQEENCKLLKTLEDEFKGVFLRFLSVGEHFSDTVIFLRHTTIATMYRLLLPHLLPEYDRCMYIDGDTLICGDIAEAYKESIGDNYVAAVRDIEAEEYANSFDYEVLPPLDQYVNAGFLIMNLKRMRDDNLVERFQELSTKKFLFCDQDIINIVCYKKIKMLPLKYNAMIKYRFLHYRFNTYSEKVTKHFSLSEIYEAQEKPVMIHYAQPVKPWQCKYVYNGKVWNDYVKYNIDADVKKQYINPYISKSQKSKKIQFKWGIRYICSKIFIYKYLLRASGKL